ncbi:predicted protein [Verticillium alfalfae VaMs.102]|uniref:Predicted protein n=1 Tax=Verticillium alfalfae (strain VaMs.102 / ATCC MYA-4576 / FGSC 10136) TaxID=526221 RepID=C9SMP0_VERA1|nr:predicted protein [Verticillium alfalfae VaMs.102]EEY20055.1 predicted protein [Verticillium alfalfae VaMs.102]
MATSNFWTRAKGVHNEGTSTRGQPHWRWLCLSHTLYGIESEKGGVSRLIHMWSNTLFGYLRLQMQVPGYEAASTPPHREEKSMVGVWYGDEDSDWRAGDRR